MLPTDWTWLSNKTPTKGSQTCFKQLWNRSKFFIDGWMGVEGFLDGNLLQKKTPTKRITISLKPGAPAWKISRLDFSMPSSKSPLHPPNSLPKKCPKFFPNVGSHLISYVHGKFHPWPTHGGVFHNSGSDLRMEKIHVNLLLFLVLVVSPLPFHLEPQRSDISTVFLEAGYMYRLYRYIVTQLGPYFIESVFK